MSKSLGNTIGVLDGPEVIWEKLRPAMTDPARKTRRDPGTPEICNIFTLHQRSRTPDQVEHVAVQCRAAGWGCLDCKRLLADNMIAALAPMRERAAALRRHPDRVRRDPRRRRRPVPDARRGNDGPGAGRDGLRAALPGAAG